MNTKQSASRRKSKARRGATCVEFALVVQVLFAIVFGAIEFSRLNMIRNLAQDAAYFAARDSMVPGASADEATAVAQAVCCRTTTCSHCSVQDPRLLASL